MASEMLPVTTETTGQIVATALAVEAALNRAGASGDGLTKKISSIKTRLAPDLLAALRTITSIRNGVAHEPPIPSAPANYVAWCKAVVSDLRGLPADRSAYTPGKEVLEAAAFDYRRCGQARKATVLEAAQSKPAPDWEAAAKKAKEFVMSLNVEPLPAFSDEIVLTSISEGADTKSASDSRVKWEKELFKLLSSDPNSAISAVTESILEGDPVSASKIDTDQKVSSPATIARNLGIGIAASVAVAAIAVLLSD